VHKILYESLLPNTVCNTSTHEIHRGTDEDNPSPIKAAPPPPFPPTS